MNWVLYGILGILAIGLIVGYLKGALRIAVSLLALAATWILVVVLSPYVTDWTIRHTTIDDWIEQKCEHVLSDHMTGMLEEEAGVEISRQDQAKIIEHSDVPDLFKTYLQENNNQEIYHLIGADSFVDYIAKGMTRLIVQILTVVVLFFTISIIFRVAISFLDVVAWLPIIGGINRIAGAVLGAGVALILVWVFFLIVTMFYTTTFGKEMFVYIEENAFLWFLYQNNPIWNLITGLR